MRFLSEAADTAFFSARFGFIQLVRSARELGFLLLLGPRSRLVHRSGVSIQWATWSVSASEPRVLAGAGERVVVASGDGTNL